MYDKIPDDIMIIKNKVNTYLRPYERKMISVKLEYTNDKECKFVPSINTEICDVITIEQLKMDFS